MYTNLNEIDYEILEILRENARISISEISRRLGISRVTVRRRIRKLVDEDIIKKFTIALDRRFFEVGVPVIVGFKTSDTERLLEELEKIDYISEIYVTSGEKNVICKATVSNIELLREILKKFIDVNYSQLTQGAS